MHEFFLTRGKRGDLFVSLKHATLIGTAIYTMLKDVQGKPESTSSSLVSNTSSYVVGALGIFMLRRLLELSCEECDGMARNVVASLLKSQ